MILVTASAPPPVVIEHQPPELVLLAFAIRIPLVTIQRAPSPVVVGIGSREADDAGHHPPSEIVNVYVNWIESPFTTLIAANTLRSHSVPTVEAEKMPCSVIASVAV